MRSFLIRQTRREAGRRAFHIHRLRKTGGFTLVETVISIAIIAILSLAFLVMFLTTAKTLNSATDLQMESSDIVAGLAGVVDDTILKTETAGEFTIEIGGKTITVDGTVHSGQSSDGEVEFRYFKPTV